MKSTPTLFIRLFACLCFAQLFKLSLSLLDQISYFSSKLDNFHLQGLVISEEGLFQTFLMKFLELRDYNIDSVICGWDLPFESIYVRFCSTSSCMSTYTGGRFRELRLKLLFIFSEPLSEFSSSVDVFVDTGKKFDRSSERGPFSPLYPSMNPVFLI